MTDAMIRSLGALSPGLSEDDRAAIEALAPAAPHPVVIGAAEAARDRFLGSRGLLAGGR